MLMIRVLHLCCRALLELLKQDIKPRDIMTKKAFENAITVVMALGGSTNAVLHLLAMAHAVDIPLTLDDFHTISDSTPFIADLKPSGKYVMEDVHKVHIPLFQTPVALCASAYPHAGLLAVHSQKASSEHC